MIRKIGFLISELIKGSGAPPPCQQMVERDFKSVGRPANLSTDVSVSFCVNPSDFYVHPKGSIVNGLQREVQEYYAEHKGKLKAGLLREGMVVAAEYSADGQVYRARITKIDLPKIHVRFVDYGNSEAVLWSKIYKLTDDCLAQEEQVMRMSANQGMTLITNDCFSGSSLRPKIARDPASSLPPISD